MQYKELLQKKLRDERILNALQQANERGEKCKYSEEQILEAQKQSGKDQLNVVYSESIHPVSNTLSSMVFNLISLILVPIPYMNKLQGDKVNVVVAIISLVILLLILQKVENCFKRDTEKNREWIKYSNKFSNSTYIFFYALTLLGYISSILDSKEFWFLYSAMATGIFIVAFKDVIKPLMGLLQRHYDNRDE